MFYYMAFAAFVAFWVKGISGFANSLIFGSIMSFRTDTINITPMDLLLNMPANLFFVWKERNSISLRVVLPLTALMFAGSIPGVLWLSVGDAAAIKVLFGFVVIGIAVEMYLRERNPQTQKSSKAMLVFIGLLGGICAGLFGISAMLAAYVTRTTENMEEFRGNICAVFLADNAFRLCLYLATGIMTGESFAMALSLAPFMVLGLAAGVLCAKRVTEKTVKNIVIFVLFLSGVLLILTNSGIL